MTFLYIILTITIIVALIVPIVELYKHYKHCLPKFNDKYDVSNQNNQINENDSGIVVEFAPQNYDEAERSSY